MLLELRDGLRSGDVWVPGSRRYADRASYLIANPEWESARAEFCQLVGEAADAAAELDAAVDDLAKRWPPATGPCSSTSPAIS